MSFNEAREMHEASFYDQGYDEPEWHIGDVEEEDEADRYNARRDLYRCTDMMCGASDCSRCHPESFDACPDEEEQPEPEEEP